ncbi:MAG TPA: S41 family peptidase [Puia sp.]|nr:S41 family peptidase [Puia sp.]
MRPVQLLLVCLSLTFSACAQSADTRATDAYLITRMAAKFHIQPRPLDKTMSAAVYTTVLKELDEERIFFTQGDIAQLAVYQYTLDQEILNRRSGFLQLLTSLYQHRLTQVDTMVDHIAAKPFNFQAGEKITQAEDTAYSADLAALHVKLYKFMKYSVATRLAGAMAAAGGAYNSKLVDSLEPRLRKRAVVTTKRMIKRILQSPIGVGNMVGIIYCQALAVCYDPHTAYFSPDEKAAFETDLGNKPLSFGLTLDEDDDGHAVVGHLEPGGPAFQSGALSEGDKITAVRWESKDPIDVSDASVLELYHILSTEGGDKLTLDIKKKDGTVRQVSLTKQRVSTQLADDEEDKVQGYLLKGARTIGYISLPAFYEDWEDNKGINGCANDVAKEIVKLKKEGIGGLILDLRYNGGGSVSEAVALAGLFIDAGPVAQVKARDEKIYTLKDVNRGTIWDGPLVVLVNGSSASASEVVAGTLQDYNRALIVGSPTFGKATAQVVLPMDTSVDLATLDPRMQASSYIKITISKLYRINGTTAQFTGVKPDILLPEPPDASGRREADEPFALPPTPIEPNKYYRALAPLPIADERTVATHAIADLPFFQQTAPAPASNRWKDESLNLAELLKEKNTDKTTEDTTEEKNNLYTVANPAYDNQLLGSDAALQAVNEERKKDVLYDPYLIVAYRLTAAMIKP